MKVPRDAYVFVGDGRKALFLRNEGDAKFVNLRTEKVFVDDNPPSREQGTDRPGRSFPGAEATRRSTFEPTDWHDLEERTFVRRVAEAMERLTRERGAKALIVAAPPRTLAELRDAFHADVSARILKEINKDLTKLPLDEIEAYLAAL